MNSEIPMAIPAMDNAGMIGFDLACINCGYNLRGLRGDGVCPECANPIGQSLRGDRLIFSSSEWLKHLRRGAALMLWYIVTVALFAAGTYVVNVSQFGPAFAMVPDTLADVLFIAAIFSLTMQEPRISGSAAPGRLRDIVRGCAVAAFVGKLVLFVAASLSHNAFGIIGILLLAGNVIAIVGTLIILRRLARRIPDEKLAKSTGALLWGTLIAVTMLIAAWGVVLFAGNVGSTNSTFDGAVLLLGCSGGVTLLLVAVMFIQTMFNYYRAFKLATQQSVGDPGTGQLNDLTRADGVERCTD